MFFILLISDEQVENLRKHQIYEAARPLNTISRWLEIVIIATACERFYLIYLNHFWTFRYWIDFVSNIYRNCAGKLLRLSLKMGHMMLIKIWLSIDSLKMQREWKLIDSYETSQDNNLPLKQNVNTFLLFVERRRRRKRIEDDDDDDDGEG